MFRKKTSFLCLFLIIAHDFRPTKAVVIDREIIDECITILFATVGVYITVYKTLYFLASYLLTNKQHSTNNTLDTPDNQITSTDFSNLHLILKEKACVMLDEHYHKNVLLLLIKGNQVDVDNQIKLFIQYVSYQKSYINCKSFLNNNDLKTIFNLVKTPFETMEIDLVFIPIVWNSNNYKLQISIQTQRSFLNWFQKKYRSTLLPYLDNPNFLKPLETLLDNYKRYDIFSTSPKERAFQIVCLNQETHDRQFIKCLKQYIIAHLALVTCGDDAKKVLCINADSLKSYALYNYPNSIFLVLDNVKNIELNTIAYKSLKPDQDFT